MVRFCLSVAWRGALDFDGLEPHEISTATLRGVRLMGRSGASYVIARLSSTRPKGRPLGLHLLPVWGRGVEPTSSCALRHAWPHGGAQPDALHACGDADCEGGSEWISHVRIDPPGLYARTIDCENDNAAADEYYLARGAFILAREGLSEERRAAAEMIGHWERDLPGAVYAQRERGEGGRE